MKVREDQPELNRAIFTSLGNMIPLMYAMVSVNMIALAWTLTTSKRIERAFRSRFVVHF